MKRSILCAHCQDYIILFDEFKDIPPTRRLEVLIQTPRTSEDDDQAPIPIQTLYFCSNRCRNAYYCVAERRSEKRAKVLAS